MPFPNLVSTRATWVHANSFLPTPHHFLQCFLLYNTNSCRLTFSWGNFKVDHNLINWSMVWTLCSYCFSAGCGRLMVLCPDDMAPCPKVILSTRRRLHGGLIAPPPSTFWRRRSNRTSPGRTVLVWRRGGSGAGAILVAAFATVAKRTMRISPMCQRRIVH